MAIELVTPNKELIQRLRKELGLSLEALAIKAMVGYRTVQKANAGQPVGMESLRSIALALETTYEALLADAPASPRIRTMVVIESDLSATKEEVAALVGMITKFLPATSEIIIKDVRKGSMLITLDMTVEDAARLVSLFPDLSEAAREYLRTTPEGQAYFRGEEGVGPQKVRRLLAMVDAVTELRIRAEEPPVESGDPEQIPPTESDLSPAHEVGSVSDQPQTEAQIAAKAADDNNAGICGLLDEYIGLITYSLTDESLAKAAAIWEDIKTKISRLPIAASHFSKPNTAETPEQLRSEVVDLLRQYIFLSEQPRNEETQTRMNAIWLRMEQSREELYSIGPDSDDLLDDSGVDDNSIF